MGLFGSQMTSLEKAIVEQNAQTVAQMMGLPLSEAIRQNKQMMEGVIAESKKHGTYNLPNNIGDLILDRASTHDPAVRKFATWLKERVPMKREEGVRDEDIRWWWNLRDVERRFMLAQDDVARLALFISLIEKGQDSDLAAVKVRGTHPIYGDLDDLALGPGDDRPLPFELKDRISRYMVKRATTDADEYRRDMDAASSFNAIVRRDIRCGKI